jgi:hypothetical protein
MVSYEKVDINAVMDFITDDCNLCIVREALQYWNDNNNVEVAENERM